MPTPKKGARLGGSATQQAHLLSNLAVSLFEHGAIKTTDAKAKMLRPYAEKIITKAKSGTLADRRAVLKLIPHKDVVAHLFDELGPKFEGREGGYTRTIKLENRTGDNAPMSQISRSRGDRDLRGNPRYPRSCFKQAEEAKVEETKAEEAEEAKAEATEAEVEETAAEESEEK